MTRAISLTAVVVLTAVGGCLSPHHTVRREELERLAAAPADARTEIRAKQRIVLSAPPEALTPEAMLKDALEAKRLAEEAAKAAAIARAAAREVDEAVQEHTKAEDEPPPQKDERTEEEKTADKKKDDSAALVVVLVVVAGVFIGAALAVSEGQRWDGDLRVAPQHPLHLRNAEGDEIGWSAVSKLTPSMLEGATEAILSEEDGPVARLRRAPLDRRGFAYGVELGAGGMNTIARDLRVGFAGRIGIGYFPTKALGFLVGTNLQTGPKGNQETAIDVRPHLELQVFPVRAGGLHAGMYGEGGRSFGSERIPSGQEHSSSSWSAGGGALLQVEMTTLLALVLRAGAVAMPDPGPSVLWSPELTVGVAVY